VQIYLQQGVALKGVFMEQWKDLFTFNRSERRGIWLLLLLLLCTSALRLVMVSRPAGDAEYIQITRILADTVLLSHANFQHPGIRRTGTASPSFDSLFFFDPNMIDAATWQLLGLSERQAAVIRSYTLRGGRFRTKEDLQRSFVISEKFYDRVAPWVRIAPEASTGVDTNVAGNRRERAVIDKVCLNRADTATLKQLRGIGVVLAERIVRYREALGGFHHESQLTEVYGVRPEVIENNSHLITIQHRTVKPLAVNTAPQAALAAHPYISSRIAYIIVELRAQGEITSPDDLLKRLPPGTEVNSNLWEYLTF
jgi:competence protein ComEA